MWLGEVCYGWVGLSQCDKAIAEQNSSLTDLVTLT